jgi:hypothetical protein
VIVADDFIGLAAHVVRFRKKRAAILPGYQHFVLAPV